MKLLLLASYFSRIRAFLAGKKTYLIAALTIVYSLGIKRGWWPSDLEIWGLLGSSVAVTLRVAIARATMQGVDTVTTPK